MNVHYLMSIVKLNLVKFRSGTSTQTPLSVSAPTCSTIQLSVDTYLKHNIHTDKMCINYTFMCDSKIFTRLKINTIFQL